MRRALPKYRKRRVAMIGGTAAVVLSGAVITGSALAGETFKTNDQAKNNTKTAAATVNCPDVAAQLPAIPATAQAEVNRNLAQLNTQIQEANNRVANTAGQGGANFVQNAVLGPLKDKRVATINRIANALNLNPAQQQVNALATCMLNNGNGNGNGNGANDNTGNGNGANGNTENNGGNGNNCGNGANVGQGNNGANGNVGNGNVGQGNNGANGNAGNGNGNAGNGNVGQGNNGANGNAGNNCGNGNAGGNGGQGDNNGANSNNNAGGANTVNCPDVAAQLPAIPATAQAEVNRNLAQLNTQIQEANNRVANTAGQGGANFVQNAVLGPLKDKRVATINRIANALDLNPANQQVNALATCTLNR